MRQWQSGAIVLPQLGELQYRDRNHPRQYPKMATIRRDAAGRYFVTVVVEERLAPRPAPGEKSVGIDLGLKDLAVLSTGEKITNPQHLNQARRRLKHEQRRLARKCKGSGRWHKQRRRVARQHARVVDTRHEIPCTSSPGASWTKTKSCASNR